MHASDTEEANFFYQGLSLHKHLVNAAIGINLLFLKCTVTESRIYMTLPEIKFAGDDLGLPFLLRNSLGLPCLARTRLFGCD